jgi:glycine cleavage system H lipoate-binding protein
MPQGSVQLERVMTHQRTGQSDTPCIWMQAGIVKVKQCSRHYDCVSCGFDRALRRTAGENHELRSCGRMPEGKRRRIVFWQDRMRSLPQWQRPCVHHLKRRISFRSCTNDYSCRNCDFDQFFQDQYAVHTVVKPVAAMDVAGVQFPQGYYLHRGHAWVKMEADGTVRIGMDDFCGRLLGPPDQVRAPLIGKTLQQGKAELALVKGEHSARIRSPVSGVITDVNPRLAEEPELMAAAPYTDGWILRVHVPLIRREMKALMMGEETETFLGGEVEALYQEIEAATGTPLAADGGTLVADIRSVVPGLAWDRLVSRFLRT